MTGFSLNILLDLGVYKKQVLLRNIARLKVADAITFAQIYIKYYYNRRYYSQFFRKGDYTLLRLYRRYDISIIKLTKRKYGLQFIESFKILERIDRLIYRLNIPDTQKVYSVFLIAQLKVYPDLKENPYVRPVPRLNELSSIFIEDNTPTLKSYKLNRILNKRIIKKGRDLITEYLIK